MSVSIKRLVFCICCIYTVHAHSQQRSIQKVEDIVDSYSRLHKLESKLIYQAKSSNLKLKEVLPQGKEAFYVYSANSNDKGGFVIVSGDESLPKVLAYSDENTFDIDNIPPAVKYWLETYVVSLRESQNESAEVSKNVKASYKSEGVAPILGKTIWGQSKPFNNLCPKYYGEPTLTGCVATAMAQVMKFHSYPGQARGYASYRTSSNNISVSHDFSKDTFDWNNMLDSYKSTYSEVQGNAVAVLMASCGASVEMDYGTSAQGGSGAYQADLIKGYIDNFGYDKDAALVVRSYCSTDDWHRLLINELNEGRPVNYAGSSVKDGGHSFVLDGYKIGNNTYPDYHVNWGWNGLCDGYYQITNLHPHDGVDYGTLAPFSESQQMTIGVKPDDGIDMKSYVFVSSKLNSSLTKVKVGGSVSFNVSSLYNCSYKKYNGRISVALKDADDHLQILSAGNRYQLEYLQGTGNFNIMCTIPNSVSEGKYTACLVYQQANTDEWSEVLSNSYPSIEVTDIEEETPSEYVWSEIGCSEMELVQEKDRSEISANVYELINLQTESFDGSLAFTFADETGSPMFSFGNRVDVPELGFYDYLIEPVRISGVIDKEIPDGHYRLYISSKRHGQVDDSYVVLNDLSVFGAPTKELFYRVDVRKSIAYIGDKEYIIGPTGINAAYEDKIDISCLYSIDGRQISHIGHKTKGVYILRSKGITKKVVVDR